jgi:hypothetical protein
MKDLAGKTFGDLEVLRRHSENTSYGAARWICRCSCDGREIVASSKDLCSGGTQSCGHRRVTEVRKANIRHGGRLTPEYTAYASAKNRCTNPNNAAYERYGGAGITFGFISFDQFLAHIGPRPSSDYSLDRWPNLKGGYEIGNVRWATRDQQAGNRRCEHCDRRNNVLELSKALARV